MSLNILKIDALIHGNISYMDDDSNPVVYFLLIKRSVVTAIYDGSVTSVGSSE